MEELKTALLKEIRVRSRLMHAFTEHALMSETSDSLRLIRKSEEDGYQKALHAIESFVLLFEPATTEKQEEE